MISSFVRQLHTVLSNCTQSYPIAYSPIDFGVPGTTAKAQQRQNNRNGSSPDEYRVKLVTLSSSCIRFVKESADVHIEEKGKQ
ncbi:hypothetical protein STEG23_012908 [Scotinomys teguina]